MGYDTNVFINCPFDPQYRELLEKLIFILSFYEFEVLMSVNKSSADDRLLEITNLIRDSKFSFHDLSRHISSKKGEIARFNMPFEFGIDFGCHQFDKQRKDKVIALIDSSPHSYDVHISDMSGRDILYHYNNAEYLFEIIPTWLRKHTAYLYDSPKRLKGYYMFWIEDYKIAVKEIGYDLRSINKIDIGIYIKLLKRWIPVWKKENKYIIP